MGIHTLSAVSTAIMFQGITSTSPSTFLLPSSWRLTHTLKKFRSLTFKRAIVTELPTIFEDEDASNYVILSDQDQSDNESVTSMDSWEDITVAEHTEEDGDNTASTEDFMSFLNNLGSTMM